MTTFYDAMTGTAQPEGYTVWISEVDSDGDISGTHHVSYHIGTPKEAKELAKNETAIDWYNQTSPDITENLHALGVAAGDVRIIEWDERQ